MKKNYRFFIFTVYILCTALMPCAGANKAPVIDHIETEMLLPDDSFGDVTFFKKWNDAGKFWKTNVANIKDKGMIISGGRRRVYSDDKLGIGNVIHSANENRYIRKICTVMKEHGVKYGISTVEFDDGRIRLYTFTYFPKGQNLDSNSGELRSDFCDFFRQNHIFSQALDANDIEAMDKLDNWNRDLMTDRLFSAMASKNGKESEEFTSLLYKARHTAKTVHRYPGPLASFDMIKVYLIYDDNGNCYSTRKPGFVIDENGDFRTYDSYEYDNCVIAPTANVPKEAQSAAKKSLEK